MSKNIELLMELKGLLMEKYGERLTFKGTDYSKSADIDTTQHRYSLTLCLDDNKYLEIGTLTNYMAFKGADKELFITVTVGGVEKAHRRQEVLNVTLSEYVEFLNNNGLKLSYEQQVEVASVEEVSVEELEITVIQTRCECGKMAIEFNDWEDYETSNMLSEKFGSLDDHYYFICECDKITRMHYTGYDCLLEDLEYINGVNRNPDAKVLFESGCWVQKNRTKLSEEVGKLLVGYAKFHEFESGNEKIKLFKNSGNNLQFVMLKFDVVHEKYELYQYKVNEDKLTDVINHFFK